MSACARSPAALWSARRKNAQLPSRKRSTRPASVRRRRWREMRGWDWRRISVRSETVSSASARSARMRRRVPSPAALRAAWSASKGKWADGAMVGCFPMGPRRWAKILRNHTPSQGITRYLYTVKWFPASRWARPPRGGAVGSRHLDATHVPFRLAAAWLTVVTCEAPHERGRVRHPPGRSCDRTAGELRRRRLLHRPHRHAVDAARAVPEECARVRGGVHHRGRGPLRGWARRYRDLQPPAGALLDGPLPARSRAASAAQLWPHPRHLRAALAGAPEPDRRERGAARGRREKSPFGRRPGLPRRHAADRSQALLRFDRRGAGRGRRLAPGPRAENIKELRRPARVGGDADSLN